MDTSNITDVPSEKKPKNVRYDGYPHPQGRR